MALNLAKDVSGENSTLKVYKDEAYRNQRINMIIDTFGNYFDLKSGALCKINPELHYFETADVKFDLEKGTEEPTEFIAFLKDRFGDEKWEIVRDHLAGTFLGPNLGSKAKLLFIVGKTNTWKSSLIDNFKDLFLADVVSNVSLEQIANDKVFGPATIVNRFLNVSGETNQKMPDNQATMKEIITGEGGGVRKMYSAKSEYAYRMAEMDSCSKQASTHFRG